MTTTNGLKGTTKCTYILNVATNAGAPAFKITKLDYWKFQLHYAEWSSDDLSGKFLATNIYTGTYAATEANIFPSPIRNTYPSGCTGTACFNYDWTEATRGNWFAMNNAAGSYGSFKYYANYEGSPFTNTIVT